MASKAKNSSSTKKSLSGLVHKYGWPALTLVSVIINVIVISGISYIVNSRPLELTRLGLEKNCTNAGYAELIKLNETYDQKKFAAAVCFTDYETGKPLDIRSLKPLADTPAQLPPKL